MFIFLKLDDRWQLDILDRTFVMTWLIGAVHRCSPVWLTPEHKDSSWVAFGGEPVDIA